MDKQTTETTVDPHRRPPDIGPAFEWRQFNKGWKLCRVYFLSKGRTTVPLASLGFWHWEDLQERLAGEELATTLANWAIGKCLEQARKRPHLYQPNLYLD